MHVNASELTNQLDAVSRKPALAITLPSVSARFFAQASSVPLTSCCALPSPLLLGILTITAYLYV